MDFSGPSDKSREIFLRALEGEFGPRANIAVASSEEARRWLCVFALEETVIYVHPRRVWRRRFLDAMSRMGRFTDVHCIVAGDGCTVVRRDGTKHCVYAYSPRKAGKTETETPIFVDGGWSDLAVFKNSFAVVSATVVSE